MDFGVDLASLARIPLSSQVQSVALVRLLWWYKDVVECRGPVVMALVACSVLWSLFLFLLISRL